MKNKLIALALLLAPSVAFAQSTQDIGTSGSSQGAVKLESATSGGSVAVQAPATSSARTITLPGVAPTNGYNVTTDASGDWSYTAPAGGGTVVRGALAGMQMVSDGLAMFTGSQSTTTLTVTTMMNSGTLAVGDTVQAIGAAETITALGTGTGGVGTYTVSSSLSIGAGSPIVASKPLVVDIGAGQAADSTGLVYITNGSAFTKSLGGSFVAGTGANGLGNGVSLAASTTYNVCAAVVSGSPDYFFDTSTTCANQPTGTTAVRRIGAVMTNAQSQVMSFIQDDDTFYIGSPPQDMTNVATSTSAAWYLLQCHMA